MVTAALPVRPPWSVTVAVSVWVPWLSAWLRSPPVPRKPSRLDVHTTLAERLPSSRSLAVALSATGGPAARTWVAVGAVIATSGGVFTTGGRAATVTWMVATVERPWPSVTDTVSVCVPWRRMLVVSSVPVPSTPSRSERQLIPGRLTLLASWALAWSVTVSPTKKLAPSAGCTTVSVGGVAGRVRTRVGLRPLVASAELKATPAVLVVSMAKL
jgi:hypothetical protein